MLGISSEALSRQDAHEPCNLGAQHHGGIENNFLVEKFPGYRPSIAFRITGRKDYHFLMRLGHLLNTWAQNTARLARLV